MIHFAEVLLRVYGSNSRMATAWERRMDVIQQSDLVQYGTLIDLLVMPNRVANIASGIRNTHWLRNQGHV